MTLSKLWIKKGKLAKWKAFAFPKILLLYILVPLLLWWSYHELTINWTSTCRSDTESAENHSTKADTKDSKDGACAEDEENHNDTSNTTDNKKESHKTSVAAKMTNFFAAMKKSVNSKSSKEKYEQTESEMKVILCIICLAIEWRRLFKKYKKNVYWCLYFLNPYAIIFYCHV